jgi:hypothetical protein
MALASSKAQHRDQDQGTADPPAQWTIEPVRTGTMDHRAGSEGGAANPRRRWLAFAAVMAAVMAGAAMFGLVYPLAQGHSMGWPGWLFGMLAASVLLLGGFGWYQVRRQRAGRDPLVEPSVFRHRPYRAGLVFSVVFVASMGGIVMIFNVFLQNGLGFTPWHSAVTTAPWAAGRSSGPRPAASR